SSGYGVLLARCADPLPRALGLRGFVLSNCKESFMRVLAIALLALLVAACAPSGTASPAASTTAPSSKLVIAQTIDAQSLDPFLVNQLAGESIMKMLFDHLIERDFDGRLVPGLAESWSIVDEQTIEFKLRQGVTFHNGEPFD